MGIEIKTFLGTIAEAAQAANEHLGGTAFGDEFTHELARTGREDGLTHLCLAVALVNDKQFVYDFKLISPALHGLQLSGMTDRVALRTRSAVAKKLKKMRLA